MHILWIITLSGYNSFCRMGTMLFFRIQLKNKIYPEMKRIFSLLTALLICLTSFAQTRATTASRENPNYVPVPYCMQGQMLNIANAYPGNALDTSVTGSTTSYLYVAINGSLAIPEVNPVTAADTFVPYPIWGVGLMTITVNVLKISGTPACTITLEESTDAVHWSPCPADVIADGVDTVANVATTQQFTFKRRFKSSPHTRVKFSWSGTETSSYSSFYSWARDYNFIPQ
jgi:hypothetical protein